MNRWRWLLMICLLQASTMAWATIDNIELQPPQAVDSGMIRMLQDIQFLPYELKERLSLAYTLSSYELQLLYEEVLVASVQASQQEQALVNALKIYLVYLIESSLDDFDDAWTLG